MDNRWFVDARTSDGKQIRVHAYDVDGQRHGVLYVEDVPPPGEPELCEARLEPEGRLRRVEPINEYVGLLSPVLANGAHAYATACFAFAARCHELELELAARQQSLDHPAR